MRFQINKEKLNAHLSKVAFYYDIAGLVTGIGTGDLGLLYSHAAGYKNIETHEKIKADDIFHMASVTKIFVGTAILKLQEKGLLSIDQPVINYLPWFSPTDGRFGEITLKQLLTHTSGLPDCTDYHWDQPQIDEDALRRYLLTDEVTKAQLLWDPSEGKFSYSNIAYEILGAVIAEISGEPFEAYISDQIFKPLDMKDSTLLTFERDLTKVASPHFKDQSNKIRVSPVFPYNRAHGPSSTLTSTIYDISKWASAHLKKQALLPESYEEVWKEYAVVPNNGEHICLSWFAREQRGLKLYGHEGTDDGFRSSFWICPELDLFITVNANMTGAPVKKISRQLLDILMGDNPKL